MTDLTDKIRHLTALMTVACLAPAAAQAQAEADLLPPEMRQFTVEVIVFRYADSVSAGTEYFVPDPPPENMSPDDEYAGDDDVPVYGDATTADSDPVPIDASGNPVELDADGNPIELDADGNPIVAIPPRADFLLLIEDELTMLSTWDRLDRLDAYEPLAHFGWHQQVTPFDEPVGIPFADFGHAVAGLDGEFTLYLSRFLHLAVALELNADASDDEPDDAALLNYSDEHYVEPMAMDSYAMLEGTTFYRIDEDRIFKSGDLRYFDHPRFGVIARIERIEMPEEAEPADAPAVTGAAVDGQ